MWNISFKKILYLATVFYLSAKEVETLFSCENETESVSYQVCDDFETLSKTALLLIDGRGKSSCMCTIRPLFPTNTAVRLMITQQKPQNWRNCNLNLWMYRLTPNRPMKCPDIRRPYNYPVNSNHPLTLKFDFDVARNSTPFCFKYTITNNVDGDVQIQCNKGGQLTTTISSQISSPSTLTKLNDTSALQSSPSTVKIITQPSSSLSTVQRVTRPLPSSTVASPFSLQSASSSKLTTVLSTSSPSSSDSFVSLSTPRRQTYSGLTSRKRSESAATTPPNSAPSLEGISEFSDVNNTTSERASTNDTIARPPINHPRPYFSTVTPEDKVPIVTGRKTNVDILKTRMMKTDKTSRRISTKLQTASKKLHSTSSNIHWLVSIPESADQRPSWVSKHSTIASVSSLYNASKDSDKIVTKSGSVKPIFTHTTMVGASWPTLKPSLTVEVSTDWLTVERPFKSLKSNIGMSRQESRISKDLKDAYKQAGESNTEHKLQILNKTSTTPGNPKAADKPVYRKLGFIIGISVASVALTPLLVLVLLLYCRQLQRRKNNAVLASCVADRANRSSKEKGQPLVPLNPSVKEDKSKYLTSDDVKNARRSELNALRQKRINRVKQKSSSED